LINGGSPGKRKPRKDSGVTDSSITNRTTELKKKKKIMSGIKDTKEDIKTTVKENTKYKKLINQNIQQIQDIVKRANVRINKCTRA
jgi:DNA-binding transcriptional regulator GbsR (MarR family)